MQQHLRSNEHGRRAHQLQLVALHGHVGQEAVDVGDSEVESLGLECVFLGHLHQPVHQDPPHVGSDVHLLGHVVGPGLVAHLDTRGGKFIFILTISSSIWKYFFTPKI